MTEPEPEPAPRSLQLARWAWIAAAVVDFARSIWQLADRQRLTNEVHRAAPELTQQQLDATVNSGVLFTLLFSLAMLVVYVGLSTRMLQGRNWARVVLAVFGGFTVFGSVVTLIALGVLGRSGLVRLIGTSVSGLDIAISVVVALLNAAALVLMFRGESNRFFQRRAPRPPLGGSIGGPFGPR